jgi:hypothetical protein
VQRINDYAYSYQTTIPDSFNNSGLTCLLERLLQQRGRSDEFCLKAVKDLMSLCLKDDMICKYIYNLPPPSYQYQRYVDWFGVYIDDIKTENDKMGQNSVSNSPYLQNKINLQSKAALKFATFKAEIQKKFKDDADQKIKAKISEEGFAETHLGKNWMVNHPEVCKDWPPHYICGKQVTDTKTAVATYEDEFCKLELMALSCEWNYSNPTGMFNLSLPEKLFRMPNYTHISYKQYK